MEVGRLREVDVEPRRPGLVDVLRERVPAERDQGRGRERRIGAQRPRDLEPVHAGEADVADDDVRPRRARPLDAVDARERELDRVPLELERVPDDLREPGLVGQDVQLLLGRA